MSFESEFKKERKSFFKDKPEKMEKVKIGKDLKKIILLGGGIILLSEAVDLIS